MTGLTGIFVIALAVVFMFVGSVASILQIWEFIHKREHDHDQEYLDAVEDAIFPSPPMTPEPQELVLQREPAERWPAQRSMFEAAGLHIEDNGEDPRTIEHDWYFFSKGDIWRRKGELGASTGGGPDGLIRAIKTARAPARRHGRSGTADGRQHLTNHSKSLR